MKKNLKLSDRLYSVISSKKEELQDQFDFWLIKQNIHQIKGVVCLLNLCNEEGELLQKYIVIEKPIQKYDESNSNYGYTVTSTAMLTYNDSFLLIPKKLAEKLVLLETFKT